MRRVPTGLVATLLAAIGLAATGVGVALAAQAQDQRTLTGEWGVLIVQPASGCEWDGVIRLRERGGRLSGEGRAVPRRSPASARCPWLEGAIQGERQRETVRFGFATGRLGEADFEGRVAADAQTMTGTWRTRSSRGDWAAAR